MRCHTAGLNEPSIWPRLAGYVVTPPVEATAEVELIVEDEQGVALDLYTLRMADGAANVVHRPAEHADAVITGTSGAWAQALGPAHTVDRLRISGNRRAAEIFLAGFRPLPQRTH